MKCYLDLNNTVGLYDIHYLINEIVKQANKNYI